jgi:dTDP-4-dehydrorhamnose 3,5-epimerase
VVFNQTKFPGVYLIDIEPRGDERGFFARTFCREEFAQRGLNPQVAQCNLSYSRKKGTLRGMHYQVAPRAEAKLVSCTSGTIYDVTIDLRTDSPTYCQWLAFELGGRERGRMLYIPEGFAHGFQTLEDHTQVFYQMSESYAPECALGVRWDDPAFGIRWPDGPRTISERDTSYPDFQPVTKTAWPKNSAFSPGS